MASIAHAHFTLTGTAVPVTSHHNQGNVVTFHNAAKSSNNLIYLGTSTVTTANGLHIDADEFLRLELGPNQIIWALSDPSGIVLEVLEQRM